MIILSNRMNKVHYFPLAACFQEIDVLFHFKTHVELCKVNLSKFIYLFSLSVESEEQLRLMKGPHSHCTVT